MFPFLWMVLVCQGQPPTSQLEHSIGQATVRIYNAAKDEGGSGVVIGRVGPIAYVLTAAHVVEKAENVEIQVSSGGDADGKPRVFNAEVVARTSSQVQDLALLRLKAARDELPAVVRVRAGSGLSGKDLDGARSIGCATTRQPTPVVEAESVLNAPLVRKAGASASARFWRCRKMPAPGRSGGALLHRDGSLIGICSGDDGKAGYYTHLDEIQRFLKANGLSSLVE
jgi:S1-C subfamily serine protease